MLLNLILTIMILTTSIEMPQLPYGMGDLAPQISEETMDYHYGKHSQGYVNNINKLIKGTKYENMTLEEIILDSEGSIFNNAAQVWNHTFFFLGLAPNPKTLPTGELAKAIDRDFGSFEKFKEEFTKAAATIFGSGWAWLVKDKDGKLLILQTQNAKTPLTEGYTPLLCMDVWEHAYYIDYRNNRASAIDAMWSKTNWEVVEERF